MDALSLRDFDAVALFEAMDAQRIARGLSWRGVADDIWAMSASLNARRRNHQDHPISPSTITGMGRRGNTTCQHALFFLRWLGRSPESFVPESAQHSRGVDLPDVGPDRRLRWSVSRMAEALDDRRREQGLTWVELARLLRCTPSQLTGLRTARYATGMVLAMRIVGWLERPAADFVYAGQW